MTPARSGRLFGVNQGADGFFLEEHPKLGPLNTATDGVFLAGCCQKPMDIPDTVSQASGAAAKALSLATLGTVEVPPTISWIDPDICVGCQVCIGLCPYGAIEFNERTEVSEVNPAVCKGLRELFWVLSQRCRPQSALQKPADLCGNRRHDGCHREGGAMNREWFSPSAGWAG